jgi:hypothetical protein
VIDVKKKIREVILLVLVLFAGYSIVLNVYLTPFIKNVNKDVKYSFIFSIIPDRITFVNFKYGSFSVLFLTMDVYLREIIKKDYGKFLNGISIVGGTFKFVNTPGSNKTQNNDTMNFNLPFCQKIKISGSKIIYEDMEQFAMLRIDNINGSSKYFNKGKKDDEYLMLNLSGNLQKRKQDKIMVKMYFFPYYKNRFNVNLFGTNIKAKSFEPLFSKYNLKIESGEVDFVVRVAGEMRKLYLNNAVQIKRLKIREDTGIDFKAVFGVSYEQIGRYLTDSNGNLYVNFDFMISDSQLSQLPDLYMKTFTNIVFDRIKMGVITAPVRQVTDLIWNLTGENVFRIFRIFGGK